MTYRPPKIGADGEIQPKRPGGRAKGVMLKPNVRCTASRRRDRGPCGMPRIKGATVCLAHGGNTPQVRAKAWARLHQLVDPAIDTLGTLLYSEDDRVSLHTAKDILDRTNYKSPTTINFVDVKKLSDEQLAELAKGGTAALGSGQDDPPVFTNTEGDIDLPFDE